MHCKAHNNNNNNNNILFLFLRKEKDKKKIGLGHWIVRSSQVDAKKIFLKKRVNHEFILFFFFFFFLGQKIPVCFGLGQQILTLFAMFTIIIRVSLDGREGKGSKVD